MSTAAIRQQQCVKWRRRLDKVSFDKARVEEKLRAEEASEAGTERIIESTRSCCLRGKTPSLRETGSCVS